MNVAGLGGAIHCLMIGFGFKYGKQMSIDMEEQPAPLLMAVSRQDKAKGRTHLNAIWHDIGSPSHWASWMLQQVS